MPTYSTGCLELDALKSRATGGQHQLKGTSRIVYVPSALLGNIFGMGGSKLEEIRRVTSAKIKIDDGTIN